MATVNEGLIATLVDELKEAGVCVDDLAVVSAGLDIFIGELSMRRQAVGFRSITRPRRFLRAEGWARDQKGNVLGHNYTPVITDMDLLGDGPISVNTNWYFLLKDVDRATMLEYLSLYSAYLKNKRMQNAERAGIELPGVRAKQ